VCETIKELDKTKRSDNRWVSKYDSKEYRFYGYNQARNGQTKSRILHGTSLNHPPTVTLWKNFEV
jgi:hypothetical protein